MNTEKTQGKDLNGAKTVQTLPPMKKTEATQAEQKTAISAMIQKFAPQGPRTAEERIQKKEQFDAVAKRFSHLKEKSNELKMFDAGNDKINAKIILQNQAGFKFEVSNSNVIKKVRDAMESELNILLSEAENEVLTFEI
jgi:hypothetical protein